MNYRKIIEKGTLEHRFYQVLGFPPVSNEDEVPLVIRITLGDMDLLDGFYMSLPASASSLSIEDAIRKHVICESEEGRTKVRQKLARDPNPDLPDIYEVLLYLYEQAEAGELALSYHINNGASDVQQTDPVHLHQHNCVTDNEVLGGKVGVWHSQRETEAARLYNLLDLVIEVNYNLDPFSGLTDEQRDAMLNDFRQTFILYLMDKFDHQPSALSPFPPDHISPILEYLASEDVGLICFDERYSITSKGHNLLSGIIAEAEFYIDNYDIFGDVYINGGKALEGGVGVWRSQRATIEIRFNTGCGENLVVPVFIREGVDPYRALFIVALYFGNMDYLTSDPDLLFSETPFEELFTLIPRSRTVEDIGTELLDRIIRAGRLQIQEQQLHKARIRHFKNIEQRIKSIDY